MKNIKFILTDDEILQAIADYVIKRNKLVIGDSTISIYWKIKDKHISSCYGTITDNIPNNKNNHIGETK